MALRGRLEVAGKKYEIIECEYEFRQTMDDTGKPTSRTTGGIIRFVTPTKSDDDQFFHKWMFDKYAVFSGTFRFVVYSQGKNVRHKTVEFKNAYCVGLKDYFNDNDNKLMYTTIMLSAESMKIGTGFMDSAVFSNEWASLASQIAAVASTL